MFYRHGYTALLALSVSCGTSVAWSQNYPAKPIQIFTTEIGGGSDLAARMVAPGLSANMGQQLVVNNRPSGVIPGEIVSRAPPDGYTLLVYGGTFWLGPLLQPKTPYDVVRDFAPITMLISSPNILVVHPSLPVKSVKDLIALAKAKPGELNYASPGIGSSPHLSAELFKSMAGVDFVRINYKGTGLGINDVIGGHVHLMFPSAAGVAGHVKSGRLRGVAVTSAKLSALLPGIPTVAASGVPGYESVSGFGMFAPARTPVAIINHLNQETVRVLNLPEIKDRFLATGAETVGNTPEEFSARLKAEIARVGKVIKDAGIRVE